VGESPRASVPRTKLCKNSDCFIATVKLDIISYSSDDSTMQGADANSMASYVVEALNTIKSLAPDPLNWGSRRILISEYGVFENWRPTETAWREQSTWYKIQNRSYSQMIGREELSVRDRRSEPVPGWHSCALACAALE
jgi:hypothetical protein